MTTSGVDDPLVGSKIGPCRIERRLAAGGMGVVYRAHHAPTDQAVAVKILAPSLAQDQEYVTRFFREAGAAGQIDHPNVIRVIDVGKHEDKYYLVMEYIEGETLDRVVERERKIPLERATRMTREVASGLAAAHRAGIIHRDVKPGNIIMSRDGRPHLTDFGLARMAGTQKGLTIEGTFLGTPEFASPEQVEGRKLDHRTDLYSLGVTYYHLLSGTLPFLGESPMEMAIKRTKEEARPLVNAFPGADPRACAIVTRLLHQDQSRRYQSMMELIRDLDGILTGKEPESGGLKPATSQIRMPRFTIESRRRARTLAHWALTGLGIVLAFLSGAMAARPQLGGSWIDSDKDLLLRFILAGGGLLAAGGAVFMSRRDVGSAGRVVFLFLLSLVMLGGALAAGAWIDRDSGAGTVETVGNSFAALGSHAAEPVSLLAMALLCLFIGAVISYEHAPGELRGWIARVMVLGGLFFAYAFGSGERSLGAPFGGFLRQAELSIPLITAIGLAGAFGLILLTAYESGGRSRTFGLLLSLGTAAGLFVFAELVGQPEAKGGWMSLLSAPFADLGRAFPRAGTPLAAVFAVATVQNVVLAVGVRRTDRLPRKR